MTTSTTYGIMDTDYILDTIVKRFITAADSRLQEWLDNTENEIMEICKENGVSESSFDTNVTNNGLNHNIKKYMVYYFCREVCEAVWCTNEVESSDNEIYKIKLDYYENKLSEQRKVLTKAMFYVDEDNLTQLDMVTNGRLFRG